jgi:post-segregation antitoxin (ccd killing protein)
MTDNFHQASRNEIIAHLRALLRLLCENHVNIKRDDVRVELIWTDVEEYTRELDQHISAAQKAKEVAEADARRTRADRDKGNEIIASLNKTVVELQSMTAQTLPHVIVDHRKFSKVSAPMLIERWSIESMDAYVDIAQYADKSGYRVLVFQQDDQYDDVRHIMENWQYLHEPSINEIIARLTKHPQREPSDGLMVYDDDE